jgi:hypothetical protein
MKKYYLMAIEKGNDKLMCDLGILLHDQKIMII